jgi:hypothetical protein
MRRRCATPAATATSAARVPAPAAMASAEATTACVTAASPAAVLRESWMGSKSEHCGERQRGKELRGSTRRLGAAKVSRAVGKCDARVSRRIGKCSVMVRCAGKARSMSAIDRAGKCDAGKLAFDCVVFCTAWPVAHLTLLAHWVERRRSNCYRYCYCAILVDLTRRCTQWLQICDFVALLACVAPTVLEFYFSIRYPALPRWARCVPRLRRWFVCRACLIPSLDELD